MADFVTDIILARDIGGFISIMENNWKKYHSNDFNGDQEQICWKSGSFHTNYYLTVMQYLIHSHFTFRSHLSEGWESCVKNISDLQSHIFSSFHSSGLLMHIIKASLTY